MIIIFIVIFQEQQVTGTLYQVTFLLVQSTYHLEIIVPHISEIIDCCFIFLLIYIYPIDFLKLLMKYVHYYFKI